MAFPGKGHPPYVHKKKFQPLLLPTRKLPLHFHLGGSSLFSKSLLYIQRAHSVTTWRPVIFVAETASGTRDDFHLITNYKHAAYYQLKVYAQQVL